MLELSFVETKKKNTYKILTTVLILKCYNLVSTIIFLVRNTWKYFMDMLKLFYSLGWKIG